MDAQRERKRIVKTVSAKKKKEEKIEESKVFEIADGWTQLFMDVRIHCGRNVDARAASFYDIIWKGKQAAFAV